MNKKLKYVKKMEDLVERKKIITTQPETLGKIRCFGCGKVFYDDVETRYRNILAVNERLKQIDKEKLVNNRYSEKELVLMAAKLRLNEKTTEDIRQKVIALFDDYYIEPFDIFKETEPELEQTKYVNKRKDLLEEMGIVRVCCKMHFQTPYKIATGMSNQITVPGLRNQFTEVKRVKAEVDDAVNIANGGYIPEPVVVKKKRATKIQPTIIKPDDVQAMMDTGVGLKKDNAKDLEAQRRDATQQLMNMRAFVEGDVLEFESPEDVAENQFEANPEPLPMETPAAEKGVGRLVYPKNVEEVKTKRGRGRPKKE